tara:strand:+ start:348 stop:806 length:459 start_codon:yes stop_codon:yes gene_type:complete
MSEIHIINHYPGAPGLRLFGLGTRLLPAQGIIQLKKLLTQETFWAKRRTENNIRAMLRNSDVVISIWNKKTMVGFGRATSDYIYRAVLWDVVVANNFQGAGIGKLLISALMKSNAIKSVEKVYLMTTNSSDFYQQMGFKELSEQKLMLRKRI